MNVNEKIVAGAYENKVPYSKENREAYRAESRKMEKKFRREIEKEFGLEDHPKRDLLWQLAWDHGHAHGWAEIYYWYDDLAALLKD